MCECQISSQLIKRKWLKLVSKIWFSIFFSTIPFVRVISSVGWALLWHGRGQWFESTITHHSHHVPVVPVWIRFTYSSPTTHHFTTCQRFGRIEIRSFLPITHHSHFKIQKSPSYHAKSLVSFNASSPRHPSVYSRFTDRFYHRSACRFCWHLVLEKDISLWSTFWSRLWSWCGDDWHDICYDCYFGLTFVADFICLLWQFYTYFGVLLLAFIGWKIF